MKRYVRFVLMLAGIVNFLQSPTAAPASSPVLEEVFSNGTIYDYFDVDLDGYLDWVVLIEPHVSVRRMTPKNTPPADWDVLQKHYWKRALEFNEEKALDHASSAFFC